MGCRAVGQLLSLRNPDLVSVLRPAATRPVLPASFFGEEGGQMKERIEDLREDVDAHDRAILELQREVAALQRDRESMATLARERSRSRGDGSRAQRRGAR